MFLDGLHQAGDDPGMVRLHRTIGHLPMALHPAPTHALVIGLGGGTTAGAVSQHPGVQVDIVEVSDSVRLAAGWFSHVNYDVLRQPGVRLHLDDGRTFLQFTSRKFDVITADIIQPIWAGAGNLYSREYFTLARQALAEGGLMLQWLGHRPAHQYKLIMRTFVDVFPEATIWLDAGLMVGSVQPLRLSRPAFERKLADPKTAGALAAVGLDSFEALRSWYTAGPADMRRFVGEGPVLTDNRPLVEYHRSLPQNDELIDVSTLRGNVADIANGN
jgi:spermidine synthase